MKTDSGTTAAIPGVAGKAPPAGKRPGGRSAFVRTKVSLFERVISIVIMCLLVGIGIAIWYKGHHFDPNIYSVPTDALASTETAIAGKAGTLRVDAAQASEGAPIAASAQTSQEDGQTAAATQTTAQTAPAAKPAPGQEPLEISLPGIKPMGETEFYSADDLYQKIDGRSPAYQSFNCVGLRCRSFSIEGTAGSYVDVYEYKMDTNVNAFGIWALERDPKGKQVPFAKDGYSGEMGYFYRQGRVYVQIIASDQDPKTMQIAQQIAENRAKVLPTDDSGLEGRRELPAAGLEPGSVSFVKENAQGQEFLNNVFQGTYDFEGKKLPYFVMTTTPGQAATAWETYMGFCGQYGGKATALPDVNGAKVFQASMFGTYKVIFQRGGDIGGVVDATEPKAALDFVTQYLQGQIQ